MRTDELAALVAEIRAAHAALEAARGRPHNPEWDAYFELKRRWEKRPLGRDAAPGDLCGPQLAGEWPNGGDIRCRRCYGVSGLEGHPYGCPRTPHDIGEVANALRRCYCGGTLVVAPEIFGDCCANTPPVPIPGGCRWCGSNLCRVGDPDDQPEKQYDVPERHPDMGDRWLHARCYDEHLLGRGHDEWVAKRRRERAVPLGVINAT
jgi:hypothetical protein